VGYSRLRDDAGLDWQIMVAVPRRDFLFRVVENFNQTVALAALAALGTVLIGLWVLATVTRELRALADAARRVGEGELGVPVKSHRRDELGALARSFVQMQSRLHTDQLTGLSNREAVIRHMQDRIERHRRRGDAQPFVVMFADFNRFKSINDRFGHDVGDRVLQEFARRLREDVRSHDMVARYAGDEFVVLIDEVADRSGAEAIRAHLDGSLRRPLAALEALAPGDATAGAAIGMALYPDDGLDVDALLKHADADMYERKRQARS
jgi:diguanylate cyclase (GGDEF)-like protein